MGRRHRQPPKHIETLARTLPLLLAVSLLGGCPAPAVSGPTGEPQVEVIATATPDLPPTQTPTEAPTEPAVVEPVAAAAPLAAETRAPVSPLELPPRVPLEFPTATPTDAQAPDEEFPSAATAEAELAIADILSATVPTAAAPVDAPAETPISAAMAAALTAVAPTITPADAPAIPALVSALAAEVPASPTEAPAESPLPEPAGGAPPVEAEAQPAPAPAPPPPVDPGLEIVADGVERTARVPILMYHYLSVPPADADLYRRDLSVAPDLFAAHLDRLRAEGYTTIRLYDLMAHLLQGAPLPEKPVILTFDDGYRDNYENAFPLLRERGMTATFFVVTDFIDEQRPEYISWEMAREMLAAGMSIESHGRNHVSLANKDDDYLIWQALGSLETIQHELGQRPRFLSYPAGDYDQRTIEIIRSANYWAAVTTEQGATHAGAHPFELARVRVRGTTTPDDLAELLQVDW